MAYGKKSYKESGVVKLAEKAAKAGMMKGR